MLAFYAVGIVGIGLKEVLDRAFYAARDTKTPAFNSIAMMIVNIGASLLLTRFMGITGIPLAYSISSVTGGLVLAVLIKKRMGSFLSASTVIAIAKMAIVSIAVYITAALTAEICRELFVGDGITIRVLRLAFPVLAGIFVYAAATALSGIDEARMVIRKITGIFNIRIKGDK
jgi:putative peptidoglycan lipid II flippase